MGQQLPAGCGEGAALGTLLTCAWINAGRTELVVFACVPLKDAANTGSTEREGGVRAGECCTGTVPCRRALWESGRHPSPWWWSQRFQHATPPASSGQHPPPKPLQTPPRGATFGPGLPSGLFGRTPMVRCLRLISCSPRRFHVWQGLGWAAQNQKAGGGSEAEPSAGSGSRAGFVAAYSSGRRVRAGGQGGVVAPQPRGPRHAAGRVRERGITAATKGDCRQAAQRRAPTRLSAWRCLSQQRAWSESRVLIIVITRMCFEFSQNSDRIKEALLQFLL